MFICRDKLWFSTTRYAMAGSYDVAAIQINTYVKGTLNGWYLESIYEREHIQL